MKIRKYFVWFKEEDCVIVNVKDDVNRPNNPDCESVLQGWIHENYGNKAYEYFELDAVESVNI